MLIKKRLQNIVSLKSENTMAALNQTHLLITFETLQENWRELKGLTYEAERKKALKHLDNFYDWILEERSIKTDQEVNDAQAVMERSRDYFKLMLYQMNGNEKQIKLDFTMQSKIREAEGMLNSLDKYSKITEMEIMLISGRSCIDELKKQVPLTELAITDEERIMIVKAMALATGHWFKCPNGHVYAIADCVGATMERNCPTCGAAIGGGNHLLRADNRLAGEMDGASHAAWSEQANMLNYGFEMRF